MYTPGQMRHVGMNNKTKARVTVVMKQLPEAPTHALVLYTDTLPNVLRDEVMILLQSNEGQREENFSDALFKNNNMLGALHNQRLLKPVLIDDIDLYPLPNTPYPLRTVIDSMRRNAGLLPLEVPVVATTTTGITTPASNSINETIEPIFDASTYIPITVETVAKKMTLDERKSLAKGLLFEADLLEKDVINKRKEAYKLDSSLKPKKKKVSKKAAKSDTV